MDSRERANTDTSHDNADLDRKVTAWLPSTLWMALLFYLSSLPQLPGPEEILTIQIIRKAGHALVFAILFVLNRRALRKANSKSTHLTLWAWTLTVLYAITDEIHQGFVPGRIPTVRDIFIDALGATLAAILLSQQAQESDPVKQAPQ